MQQERNNEEVTKVARPNRHILLDEWLEKVNATTLWSKSIREDLCVECYRIGDGIAIVQRYDRGGWDIFTSGNMIMIPTTLRDAERRLGINPAQIPEGVKVDAVKDAGPLGMRVDLEVADNNGVTISKVDRCLTPDAAEALGLAIVAAADRARDPRNGT